MDAGPRVTLIAAVARNGVIGDGTSMPWHLPADLRFFKRTTMGHPMVMGRRTFDTMGVLPGRRSVVVTRDPGWSADGAERAGSLEEALAVAATAPDGSRVDEVFVVGGGEIYRLALPTADRVLVTEVDLEPEGSVTFPAIDPQQWRETAREVGDGFAVVTWERRV